MPENWTCDFAITLTLNTKAKRAWRTAEEQYDQFEHKAHNHHGALKWTLVVELTQNYDCHIHGIFRIDMNKIGSKYHFDPRRWIHEMFKKDPLVGFIKVDQITDHNGWMEYINKSLNITSNTLKRYPIVIDELDLFPEEVRFQLAMDAAK